MKQLYKAKEMERKKKQEEEEEMKSKLQDEANRLVDNIISSMAKGIADDESELRLNLIVSNQIVVRNMIQKKLESLGYIWNILDDALLVSFPSDEEEEQATTTSKLTSKQLKMTQQESVQPPPPYSEDFSKHIIGKTNVFQLDINSKPNLKARLNLYFAKFFGNVNV